MTITLDPAIAQVVTEAAKRGLVDLLRAALLPRAEDEETPATGERDLDSRVDLCGLDYYGRRQRLFTALRGLQPGQVLQLISEQADDVYWLRYEAEARMAQRYRWSLPTGTPGAVEPIVQLP